MKAKLSKEGVYLEFQVSEHEDFLSWRTAYENQGVRCEAFNGQDDEGSWIKSPEYIKPTIMEGK